MCTAIVGPEFDKPSVVFLRRSQSVKQEHTLGCAVACVAFRHSVSYGQALSLFGDPQNAWKRGYLCEDVVDALAQAGLRYQWETYDYEKHSSLLEREGTIVFIGPSETDYPAGHYLIRAKDGWMNSWVNFPRMLPVQSGFQNNLRGCVEYVIWEET